MTSQSPPTISVVVAVRNGAATLKRCLDSFVAQTYPHREIVVIDGGSTDGTLDIIEKHGSDIAYWESAPDHGISHAWNKALEHVTGDWICFVGSDDFFWEDDALARLAPVLADAVPNVRIVYGRIAVVDRDECVLRYEGQDWSTSAASFTRAMNLPHPGLMHHCSIFDTGFRFDESLRICADYDLLLHELPARDACFAQGVVLLAVQHGGLSYSPSAMGEMLRELAYIRRKHGLRTPGLANSPPVLWKMRLCALTTTLFGENAFQRAAGVYRRVTRRHPPVALPRHGGL